MPSKVQIGCIADDFTGASDVCSFLMRAGARCLLLNSIPEGEAAAGYDVVVIALKIRSIPRLEAVEQAGQALRWLQSRGVQRFYYKYCSTFDSTAEGNIGPVLDYMLEALNQRYTVLSPALPDNQRTVFNGYLFAGRSLLSESSMSKHPLNPMTDSFIPRLMERQSACACHVLNYLDLERPAEELRAHAEGLSKDGRCYLCCDYFEQAHGDRIAAAFGGLKLLSGSSALIRDWYLTLNPEKQPELPEKKAEGSFPALILSGSLSSQTRVQVSSFARSGGKALPITLQDIERGAEGLRCFYKAVSGLREDLLIYSSVPSGAAVSQDQGQSARVEEAMADLAAHALKSGVRRLIVAGGETSGAVITRLGFKAFDIGSEIAPGVPILRPVRQEGLQVVLKSGNFGQDDFFRRAISLMEG